MTEIESLRSEVRDLTRAVTLLMTERFGEADPAYNLSYSRSWCRGMIPRWTRRDADAQIAERRSRIRTVKWTGLNTLEVQKFAAGRASIVAEGGLLTVIYAGKSFELDIDEILAHDPISGQFFRGLNPDEMEEYDQALQQQRAGGTITIPSG